ncbi:MAG: cadherin-like beta sandwich domain-containing protein [Synergistaceae bacterium]|jgi:hypothetical protein
MPNEAKSAFGTSLSWGGNVIAGIETITYSGITMSMATVHPHDAASRFAEVVATVGDSGEIGISGVLYLTDTDGQIAAIADAKAGTKREAIITGPDDAPFTWTMDAIFTNFTPDFDRQGVLTYSATLKASGEPVFAYTLSANLTALSGIEQEAEGALTFTPSFAAGTYEYNVTINTASTWIKLTPTLLGATITISNGTSSQDVLSGAQSGTIAVTDGGITTVTLAVKETGKVAKTYTLHVYTP